MNEYRPLCAQSAPSSATVTIPIVLHRIFCEPRTYLLARWNWKSAVTSSAFRAILFFCVNLTAGFPAARAAFLTELVFRGITSGFYGALTEAFRDAEPPWAAAVSVMLLLPVANHSVEFLVHWLRGTQRLGASIVASMIFTAFSSLFNWYAMRRGALIVGQGKSSLLEDLARMPRLVVDFIIFLPKLLIARDSRRSSAVRPLPQRSV
jgi:hypothetical protein